VMCASIGTSRELVYSLGMRIVSMSWQMQLQSAIRWE